MKRQKRRYDIQRTREVTDTVTDEATDEMAMISMGTRQSFVLAAAVSLPLMESSHANIVRLGASGNKSFVALRPLRPLREVRATQTMRQLV
jgi:hypothetical protein